MSDRPAERRRALAAVYAHPDDETFAIGGAIARYAAAGVECHLYCATDGDAGRSSGVQVASREELGRLRRRELETAAGMLGFASVRSAGHPDGALGSVDTERLVGEVVAFLREHRPDVVLTFGPEGAPTGHRDHRVISRIATTAFFLAGLATEFPEQLETVAPHAAGRLYYVSWPPPDPASEFPRLAVPLTARVDIRAHHARMREAFMAHTTQREHLGRFEVLALTDDESFALAAGVPQPAAIVDDLFQGL